MKYKIVKVTNKDGHESYTIKVKFLGIWWIEEAFINLHGYSGDTLTPLTGLSLEEANKYLESLKETKKQQLGNKVKIKETVKIIDI